MKKYLYLILCASLFAACSSDDDRIFSESSAIRANEYVSECNSILKASAQGWKMVYTPDTTWVNSGSYTFLMKFQDNNRVSMASEFSDEILTSSYRIDMSQSAMLVFDTYNYIHELAYPNNNPPYGLNGDFEFLIQNKTDHSLDLIGRKKRVNLVLEKAVEQDWTDIVKQSEIQKNIELKVSGRTKEIWAVKYKGADIKKGSLKVDPIKHTYTIVSDSASVTGTYSITPDGLSFNKSVSLKVTGDEVISFNGLKYQAGETPADRKFVSNDAAGSLVFGIKTETVYLYQDYLGTYTLRYATSNAATARNRSLEVTLVAEQPGSTYRLEGLLADDSPGKIYLNYSASGNISLLGQVMYVYPDTKYDFWLLPYSYPINGNYTSRSTTYGVVSSAIEMSPEGKLSFDMVDNGLWQGYGGVAGFILRNYNGSTNAGNVNGGKDGQYAYFFLRFEMK
ncbi:MAG: DUF4302 domain-containing protein [Dysgonamonadaceae bacterium]|nr:DUF4302 domain-containing protein [Dysgonamonadaceae bacterium]